jgi:WD40 repeat protein
MVIVASAWIAATWAQNALPQLWMRAGFPSAPRQAAFSPEGQYVAIAGLGSVVPIVRVSDRLVEREIRLPEFDRATAVAFSPDGSYLAIATTIGAIWIVRVADGQPVQAVYPHAASIVSFAFSPDGRYLVSTDGSFVQVARSADGALVRTLWHLNPQRCLFSPDGTRIATVSESNIQLWSFPEGAPLLTIPISPSWNSYPAVGFSPDGQFIAGHFYPGNEIRIWRTDDGSLVRRAVYNARVLRGLAFTPDGGYIVSAHENAVILWDVVSLTPIYQRNFAALDVAVSRTGGYFLTTNNYFTRLWAIENLTIVDELSSFVDTIEDVVFSPSGATVVSVNQEFIRLWNPETGALQGGVWIEARGGTVAVSPADESLIAVGGKLANVGLYDLRTNQWRHKWSTSGSARQMEFSPDGALLAVAIGTSAVFHRVATNTRFSVNRSADVRGVRWVDTQRCLILEATGQLVLWNVAQNRSEHALNLSGSAVGLTLTPDRRLAAVNLADRVALVRLPELTLLRFIADTPAPILSAHLMQQGRYLVTGDAAGRIHIWRTADSALVFRDESAVGAQPSVTINRVAVDPEGQIIIFSRSDGVLTAARNPFPPGDVNSDRCVNDADLLAVLFAFGSDNPLADLNANGIVDDADLLQVLFDFGTGCN